MVSVVRTWRGKRCGAGKRGQACLIEPLDPASSGLMEEAGKQAEPGLAAIADAVLAARREAISLLVRGHRLSSSATLLPQQSPAGDMSGWVDAWKEAIRLARERGQIDGSGLIPSPRRSQGNRFTRGPAEAGKNGLPAFRWNGFHGIELISRSSS